MFPSEAKTYKSVVGSHYSVVGGLYKSVVAIEEKGQTSVGYRALYILRCGIFCKCVPEAKTSVAGA